MTSVTGSSARAERTTPAEFFGYPPVSRDTACPVAPRGKTTPAPVDFVDRNPEELTMQARMFLDGA